MLVHGYLSDHRVKKGGEEGNLAVFFFDLRAKWISIKI